MYTCFAPILLESLHMKRATRGFFGVFSFASGFCLHIFFFGAKVKAVKLNR